MKKVIFILLALFPVMFVNCNNEITNDYPTIDSIVDMSEAELNNILNQDVDFEAFVAALETKSFRQEKEYRNTGNGWQDYTLVPGDCPELGFYIDGDVFIGIYKALQQRDFYFDYDNKSIHTSLSDEICKASGFDEGYKCEAKLIYFNNDVAILEGEICYGINCYGPGGGQGWIYRYVGVMDEDIRKEWEEQYNN